MSVRPQTLMAAVATTHENENDPGAQRECLAKAWSKASRVCRRGHFPSLFSEQGERRGQSGFTIIEVMVAVMIFAVAVVSIFGAQFTAISTARYARYTTAAIGLARCKMSELELEIQINNGFEEGDVSSSGSCCEVLDGETMVGEFDCRWQIEPVEMPSLTSLLLGGGDGTDSGGGGGLLGDLGVDMGDTEGADPATSMIASLAPMLGDLLKQAIRRVTVTVEWKQGAAGKEFVLQQYLVHPTQGPDLMMLNAGADAQEAVETLSGEGAGAAGMPGMPPGMPVIPGGPGGQGPGAP